VALVIAFSTASPAFAADKSGVGPTAIAYWNRLAGERRSEMNAVLDAGGSSKAYLAWIGRAVRERFPQETELRISRSFFQSDACSGNDL